mmetsp:Transcript_20812/g.29100  ORF Transcript_20812/g.29100 Transcript_20812/m.29100 type:complete len:380 (+) Transcript_20812:110-1249(+)
MLNPTFSFYLHVNTCCKYLLVLGTSPQYCFTFATMGPFLLTFTLAALRPALAVWELTEATNAYYPALNPGPVVIESMAPLKTKNEMIMIRTYRPTDLMIQRMKKIIHDNPHREVVVAFNKPEYMDMVRDAEIAHRHGFELSQPRLKHIGNNETRIKLENAASQRDLERVKKTFGDRLIWYTNVEVENIFPALKDMVENTAMSYHDHCIYVALRKWEKLHRRKWEGSLWVLEDDVEYSGDWSKLFDKYAALNVDLVASGFYRKGEPFMVRKHWDFQMSEKFRKKFFRKEEAWVFIFEHIVRYSPRFLKQVHSLLESGHHARSEIGTGTIAKRMNYLSMGLGADIQQPWFCTGHCCDETCMASIEKNRARGVGKLYHPVKV